MSARSKIAHDAVAQAILANPRFIGHLLQDVGGRFGWRPARASGFSATPDGKKTCCVPIRLAGSCLESWRDHDGRRSAPSRRSCRKGPSSTMTTGVGDDEACGRARRNTPRGRQDRARRGKRRYTAPGPSDRVANTGISAAAARHGSKLHAATGRMPCSGLFEVLVMQLRAPRCIASQPTATTRLPVAVES